MASMQDPTPCPPPRGNILSQNRRLSLLEPTNPSSFLPDYTKSFRDAKPRRPRTMRQSIGWDPAVDIYEDTFAFQMPRASAAKVEGQPPAKNIVGGVPRRASAIFTRPNQSNVRQSSNEGVQAGPLQNRPGSLATTVAPNPPNINKTLEGFQKTEIRSTLLRNPRRRTIYIPSEDTTVLSIHPGNAEKYKSTRPVEPRHSDVFLDIATVSEENASTLELEQCSQPKTMQGSNRRLIRQSLDAAPKRLPLQQSSEGVLNECHNADVSSDRSGKENIPPGRLGEVKRLGKRASLVFPDKVFNKRVQGLETLREDSPAQQKTDRSSARQISQSNEKNKTEPSKLCLEPRRRISIIPRQLDDRRRHASQSRPDIQKNSMLGESAYEADNAMKAPKNLTLPRKSLDPSSMPRFPVITEDISKPEMYEEHWLSHQEVVMTQLINVLLSPNQNNKLLRHKKLDIRKTLIEMYQTQSNVLLYRRLQASLRFGALSISTDTLEHVVRFKDDCGQRQRFLDLWLKTYTPSSLRLVVETIIGRQVIDIERASEGSSPSSNETKSLSIFLKTFLVKNHDAGDHSSSQDSSVHPAERGFEEDRGCRAWSWRRTVLRSLMLILMLDKAQEAGVFGGCLFRTSSPYKSSSSVLQGLCKLLIPSIGDVSRVLGHLNYNVSHIQYPLQEYCYYVNNLAADLRDGVRLAKITERLLYPIEDECISERAITKDPACGEAFTSKIDFNEHNGSALTQHLRYPCLSRAQKIYNVQISLSALSDLEDVGSELEGVDADSIVDGHREKTTQLLWCLMSRWGMPNLVRFDLIENEIKRLDRRALERQNLSKEVFDASKQIVDAELHLSTGRQRQQCLLKSWAARLGRQEGIAVTNLSTSFADGRAYQAIVHEYSSFLQTSTSCPDKRNSTLENGLSLTRTLEVMGCSQAFIDLFKNTSTVPTIQTTIPLLAFLASRLLPPAEPQIAARTIQMAWRRSQARFRLRQRVKLAMVARGCAAIVLQRQKEEWAACVIQRKWKEVCWK